MTLGIRPALLAVALVLVASGARALPQCEEETSLPAVADEPGDAHELADDVRPGHDTGHDSLPIVPCAMVESGVLGPACTDASFYVVTDAGVLLCTVDVDTFHLAQAPEQAIEQAPATPTSSVGSGLAGFAVVPEAAALPPCLARDLPVGTRPPLRAPLDRTDRPPVPPS